MNLTREQQELLENRDSDGRVFARDNREVRELVEKGYLEDSAYQRGCYLVRKNPDGSPVRR